MAMGIRLAKPDATVVSIVGDGVAYFGNPQSALAVGVRYRLPTLTLILDNGGWGAVKEATAKVYPEGHAARLGAWQANLGRQTDFAMVAQAAGAFGATLTHSQDVREVLTRALDAVRGGQPAVVHVHIAPFEDPL
jgi:acetolactate synthase-1/2/3 large subunit